MELINGGAASQLGQLVKIEYRIQMAKKGGESICMVSFTASFPQRAIKLFILIHFFPLNG